MHTLTRLSFIPLVGFVAVSIFLAVPLFLQAAVQNSGGMCTEEAMQCPDGSWVGRTGPNCEFVCGGVSSGGPSTPPSGGGYQGSIPPSSTVPATPPSGTYTNYPGTEHPYYPDYGGNTSGVCSQDAMQCPDGSWVGRSGVSCQFMCPAGGSTPSPITPPVGLWNGFLNYWYPQPVYQTLPAVSQIAPPVGTFEGDPSMFEDMTPIFSVSDSQEVVFPPEEESFLGSIGNWFTRFFSWFR